MDRIDTPDPQAVAAAFAGVTAEVLWAASADGLLLVDSEGHIRATNPALDRLFGYGPGELLGRSVEQLVPADLRSGHVKMRSGFEASPSSRPMAARRMLHGARRDGSTFSINVSLGRLPTADGELSMAAVRDLSDRVEVERREADANRRRALAEDHDRIASDLHDTVIQRLFALGLGLQGLLGSVEQPEVESRLSAAVDTIDEIISDIRDTIFGLRQAPAIGPVGLRQRVIMVLAEMEPSLGFAPELRFQGPLDELSAADIASDVEPVIREALSNVARHAEADHAVVTLTVDEGGLRIEVVDNGRGIHPGVVRSGLTNLAERALAFEGHFTVDALATGGTHLGWSVPLPPQPD